MFVRIEEVEVSAKVKLAGGYDLGGGPGRNHISTLSSLRGKNVLTSRR
jgi:hypothetical protein